MKNCNETRVLTEKLNSIYQSAQTANTIKAFFLFVNDYIEGSLNSNQSRRIINIFDETKENDYKEILNGKKKLGKYIEQTIPKLKSYSLKNNSVELGLKEIISLINGTIRIGGDIRLRVFKEIEIIAFQNLENKEFLNLLGVEGSTDTSIKQWQIREVYKNIIDKIDKIEILKENRSWWAWQRLYLFYKTLNEEISNDKELRNEINNILNFNTDETNLTFKYSDYKIYLDKVHKEIIQILEEIEKMSHYFSLDKKTGSLVIDDKKIEYSTVTRKFELLKLITKDSKEYSFDQVAECMDKISFGEFKNKNKYYQLCKSIKRDLAKIEKDDFLKFEYNKVKVNPKYKKIKE